MLTEVNDLSEIQEGRVGLVVGTGTLDPCECVPSDNTSTMFGGITDTFGGEYLK